MEHIIRSLSEEEVLKNRCSKYKFIEMENIKLEEAAAKYADRFVYKIAARKGFTSGATWMQEQKQKEIDELVTALEEIGNIVYGHEWYDHRNVMNSRIEDIQRLCNKVKSKYNEKQ